MNFRLSFFVLIVFILTAPARGQVTPAPSQPPDGATDQSTTVTLRWVPVLLATSYDVQVSTTSDFSSMAFNLTGITETSQSISNLGNSTTYYWRVRAVTLLVAGLWSNVARFTTAAPPVQPPAAPSLSAPANGSTGQSKALDLTWNSVSGAVSYRLEVSADQSFSSTLVDLSSITSTSQVVSGLANTTVYYWRVRAQNPGGSGPWSEVWRFTTVDPTPQTPSLIDPPNGSIDQPSTVSFRWGAVPNAETYRFQISTDTMFTTPFHDLGSLTSTTETVSGLAPETLYFWRVRAENSSGSGPWSSAWSLRTRAVPPAAPVLQSPPDGSVDQTVPITLAWSPPSGATACWVQVSTTSSFSSLVMEDSLVSETSKVIDGLNFSTQYFWRVSARNASGTGAWSNTWSFTTQSIDSSKFYSLSTTIDFPVHQSLSDYSTADYKIVGLPGESNRPLPSLLTGTAGRDWQAYWDRGTPTDYWVTYDGGPAFVFSLGRAFWILNRGPWVINTTVPVPSRTMRGQVAIPLHEGWNLITDPFLKSVPWTSVELANSVNEPLYEFVAGRYQLANALHTFTGYYFFNQDSLASLVIPDDTAGAATVADIGQPQSSGGWRVRVLARCDSVTDDVLWFGAEPGADDGRDRLDVHKPHAFFQGASTYFLSPQWDSRFSTFATDIRGPLQTLLQWEIHIDHPVGREVLLSFLDLDGIPSPLVIYLIDKQNSTVQNLRTTPRYRFLPETRTSRITILVGPSDLVREMIQHAGPPQEFSIGANYPNPFNPSTTIPFTMPHQAAIRLSAYDILGRRVRTILDRTMTAGNHEVVWDGRNDAGEQLASGAYFINLSVEGGPTLTRNVVLAR